MKWNRFASVTGSFERPPQALGFFKMYNKVGFKAEPFMRRNVAEWSSSRQCCGSVSGVDPDWIRIEEVKNDPQNRKKSSKFNFLKCGMFSFLVFKIPDPDPDRWIRIRNTGSWRSVSYKNIRLRSDMAYSWSEGNENSSKIIDRHWVANPDSYRSALFLEPGSGSALQWKAGSVSAKWNEGCGSGSALNYADTQPWLEMNHETTIKYNTV